MPHCDDRVIQKSYKRAAARPCRPLSPDRLVRVRLKAENFIVSVGCIKKRHAPCSGMPGRSLIYKDRFHRVMGVAHDAEPSDPDILGFFRRIKDGAHTIAI